MLSFFLNEVRKPVSVVDTDLILERAGGVICGTLTNKHTVVLVNFMVGDVFNC